MKPFNLEEAKAGKPVCTRDGKPARIICYDVKTETNKYPIFALVSIKDNEACLSYTKDGKYASNDCETNYDLMMASEKHEGWINLYGDDMGCGAGYRIYNLEQDAIKLGKNDKNYITTVKIEWEE